MMKGEFIANVGQEISQADYDVVERVYMDYPNMDKAAVYALYKACGLVAFKDLLPRATAIYEAEEAIRKQQAEIKRLQEGGGL